MKFSSYGSQDVHRRGKETSSWGTTSGPIKEKQCQGSARSVPSTPNQVSMASRAVTMGKKVCFQFLDEQNFCIGTWIQQQGWEKLCSLKVPTCSHLVWEFFENLRLDSESIWFEVKGTEIILDQRRLGHLLKMPSSGFRVAELHNDFDGMQRLFGSNILEKFDIHNSNLLLTELKFLHSIIFRIFFPRIGRFD